MTGIEELRDVCRALKGSPWFITNIATIGGEPAYEKLRKIADQIEREMLPRTRFEDGKVARIGEVARYLGKNRTIANIYVTTSGYHRVLFDDNVDLTLRPSEMLLRPVTKVLDADGVEIKVGDEVWEVEDGIDPLTVVEINGERVIGKSSSAWCFDIHCSKVTHKRPEPPDSWERIEADVNKGSACRYFGVPDSEEECGKCTAQWDEGDMSCAESMARDVLRRCKRLAGVE